METGAKKRLMERLDRNLLEHAKLLGKEDGPTISLIYHLQQMAEIHCYLKTEHEFNAAEVDDLLQFADPLTVAVCCWEENPHEYSFPICELLETVQARERFPAMESTPPPGRVSVRDRLRAAMKEVNRQSPQQDNSHDNRAR